MPALSETAVVGDAMELAEGVEVGHSSVIGHCPLDGGYVRPPSSSSPARGRIGDHTVIGHHVTIGDGTVLGAGCFVDSGCYIGHDCRIADNVSIMHKAQIHNRVAIDEGTWIGGFVCNHAVIGKNAVVYGKLIHRFVDATVGIPEPSPEVGDEAFVGEGAIVIGGVKIGARAYVAAGSIVTSDVAPNTLCVGSPARIVGPAPTPFAARRHSGLTGQTDAE